MIDFSKRDLERKLIDTEDISSHLEYDLFVRRLGEISPNWNIGGARYRNRSWVSPHFPNFRSASTFIKDNLSMMRTNYQSITINTSPGYYSFCRSESILFRVNRPETVSVYKGSEFIRGEANYCF